MFKGKIKKIIVSVRDAFFSGLYRHLDMQRQKTTDEFIFQNTENRLLNIFLNLPNKVLEFFYKGVKIRAFIPNGDIDGIQKHILKTRTFYEIEFLEVLYEFVRERKGLAIDVGANIGNHTLFFSKICDFTECYSFEPNPAVAYVLRQNVKLNGLNEKVTVVESGVGARKDVMYLGSSPQDNLGATKLHEKGFSSGRVEVIAIDDMGLTNVDFIKVDVEGMALEVLKGARQTIITNKPILFVEIFDDQLKESMELISSLGYRLERSLEWGNYIFKWQGDHD